MVSWPCCSTLSPRASLAADARVPRGALESLATSAEEDGLAGVDGDGDEDEDGERGLAYSCWPPWMPGQLLLGSSR